MQPDGKIVFVGSSAAPMGGHETMGVVRVNPDGSLDQTFGGTGKGVVLIDFGAHGDATATAVALQSNGDIVVAGATDSSQSIAVARLTPSGLLDSTFGAGSSGEQTIGTAATSQHTVGLAVQPSDQKIVVVGTRDVGSRSGFQVSRLTTTGQTDTSFAGGTVVTTVASGANASSFADVVLVQGDGKIVAAGAGNATGSGATDLQVARYDTNGTLDASFNAGGTADIPIANEGSNGVVTNALAIQGDGKLVLAGGPPGGPQTGGLNVDPGHTVLVRLKPNGTPDAGFSGGGLSAGEDAIPFPGTTADTANGVVVDPTTGRILVAGTALLNGVSEIIADRVNSDGSLDQTFGDPGSAKVTPGGTAAVELLMTVSHTIDALIGGNVNGSPGGVAITTSAASPSGGGPPPPPGGTRTPGSTAPVLSGLRIAPSSFRAAPRGATLSRAATGATITYADSEATRTTFTVQRPAPGVTVGGKCVKPSRRTRKRRRCQRYSGAGSFSHIDVAGAVRLHFSGRIDGRRLPPGRYRLLVRGQNAAGQLSALQVLGFTIKR